MTARVLEAGGDPAASNDRVTIAGFESPVEAQIARGMLEAEGIECFLVGENVNHLLPVAFRVRLQVAGPNESAARELLQGAGRAEESGRS